MRASEMFDHWSEVRGYLYAALDGLSEQHLQFTPRAGIWSLGRTLCHIARVEDGEMAAAAREFKGWDAVDYQLADYPTPQALRRLLEAVHERTMARLERWDLPDLEQVVDLPWGEQATRRWVIWHVLEHEIHHRGEVFLMMGMQGLETPDL